MEMVKIGELVAHARRRVGLSARQLSAQAGLSASYVTKLEAGELEPSLHSFARIAMATKMTQAEVFFCVVQESLREVK